MSDPTILRIERVIDASPDAVYRAWTTPELMERWYEQGDAATARVVEHELQVGGTFRIEFGPRGEEPFIERGTYLELDPPHRVVINETLGRPSEPGLGWTDTKVTVEFLAEAGKTRLVLTHEGLDDEQRAGASGGWPEFVERLAALVERASSPA